MKMIHKNTISNKVLWLRRFVGMFLFVTLFVGGVVGEAEASTPRILRPGTRAAMYQGSLGPVVSVNNGSVAGYLSNVIGFHFSGTSSGPALGGVLDLTFATGFVEFILGGRFWWDIPIAHMAIYVAPFVQPGFVIGSANGAFVGFDLQFGADLRVLLNNRLILSLRPISFDLQILGTGFGVGVGFAIQFMHLGVGVTF